MKTCNSCGLSKGLSEFGKDGKRADGTIKLKGHCLECAKIKRKKAREANPDKFRQYEREWTERNREKKNAQARARRAVNPEPNREATRRWRLANPDKVKQKNHEWHKNNPEAAREKNRRWHQSNPERRKENTRRWVENNRDIVRGNNARYFAAKRAGTVEPLPRDYMTIVKDFYGNVCLNPECTSDSILTLDHIVPLYLGGEHSFRNFQILCKSCNSSKKHLHETDYRPNTIIVGWKDDKPITEERANEIS
ncbi:HNH endonuclease [Streptomyces phage Samisti12]|uniref:HNH endonuclease n=2 Tax=Samistivirus TaxID=2560220 RepID=A0A223FZS8_9CAUD|nr:endonuclease VII [Streptomyces phage Samisti12]YP_010101452.1 endonuclease VII [Streptomyces phage EGole]AST15261.1 HNH endonuclease [Streptomyces phage Samisti12]QBP30828.1 HNH endonuclease [Streptomyces phage EGole]